MCLTVSVAAKSKWKTENPWNNDEPVYAYKVLLCNNDVYYTPAQIFLVDTGKWLQPPSDDCDYYIRQLSDFNGAEIHGGAIHAYITIDASGLREWTMARSDAKIFKLPISRHDILAFGNASDVALKRLWIPSDLAEHEVTLPCA